MRRRVCDIAVSRKWLVLASSATHRCLILTVALQVCPGPRLRDGLLCFRPDPLDRYCPVLVSFCHRTVGYRRSADQLPLGAIGDYFPNESACGTDRCSGLHYEAAGEFMLEKLRGARACDHAKKLSHYDRPVQRSTAAAHAIESEPALVSVAGLGASMSYWRHGDLHPYLPT